MRLIEADLLKQNCKITGGFNDNFVGVDLITLARVIDNQPTAYDVEKVVKELEEAKGNVPGNRFLDDIIKEKPKELGQLIAYERAIEIVKQGGVSESEQKLNKMETNND